MPSTTRFACCAGLAVSYRIAVLQHQAELERLREDVHDNLAPIRGDLSREVFTAVHFSCCCK